MIALILIHAGLVAVVTKSTAGSPIRSLAARAHPLAAELFDCPLCFGWWAGLGMALYEGGRWKAPMAAFGFAMSSAILVGLWRLLVEAEASLAWWRWLHQEPRCSTNEAIRKHERVL